MEVVITVEDDAFERIQNAQSVPDMYGTDIVNALNAIKFGKKLEHSNNYKAGWHNAIDAALKEVYTIPIDETLVKVVQAETLEGLGMSEKAPTGDLISRSKLLDHTTCKYKYDCPQSGSACDRCSDNCVEVSDIINAPGISDRPEGELRFNYDSVNDDMLATYFCSLCNAGAYGLDNFCHNCGAKLHREGSDNG